MKSREDYPFWFYFDDYDEDDQGYEKEINWIDFEEEEDERDNDFNFPIWQDSHNKGRCNPPFFYLILKANQKRIAKRIKSENKADKRR